MKQTLLFLRSRRHLLGFLTIAVLSGLLTFDTASAVNTCARIYAAKNSVAGRDFQFQKILDAEKLNMSKDLFESVEVLFEKYDVKLTEKNLPQAIQEAFYSFRGRSQKPSLEKSENMALLGDELIKLVSSSFNKKENMMIGYHVAEAVIKLEQIQRKEYVKKSQPTVFAEGGVIHISEFHNYVESYIKGTDLYGKLSDEVDFISWPNIRNLYSNNTWAVGLRHHDMYHLHYAYGHPYYLGVNFMTSRSINDRRYAMVSSLWEAVDNNQTGFESKMAGFFKERNLSPQEGMIYLGRATKAMLQEVDSYSGDQAADVASTYQVGYGAWKPIATQFGRVSPPDSLAVFDLEIQNFINTSLEKMSSSKNAIFYNYHRLGPGKSVETDQDKSIN